MELDNLVVSFLDLEANKGLFRKELAKLLKILPSDIDVWFESEYTGTVHQYIKVDIHERLSKKDLEKLDFDFIDEDGYITYEVGDIVL
jgi:hypothetical protein